MYVQWKTDSMIGTMAWKEIRITFLFAVPLISKKTMMLEGSARDDSTLIAAAMPFTSYITSQAPAYQSS